MTGNHRIIVIFGSTGSGKSALALALAEKIGAEILAVDSMTVYRDMNIGTAKPSIEERSRVTHHLIDVVAPNQNFAVAQFVELADAVIANARARDVPLIATGGTPMYYKSLFDGLFDGPGADDAVRSRLNEEPLETLHARLVQVDPLAASRIHVNDRKRLVRALEVFELTGKPISSFQNEWASGLRRHHATWFGLLWDKDVLNRRINARTKQMIADGWLAETSALLQKYGQLSMTAAEATGYQELTKHLQGQQSLDDAIELTKIATRQLARRQMKWFRRFPEVTWLDGQASTESHLERICSKIS